MGNLVIQSWRRWVPLASGVLGIVLFTAMLMLLSHQLKAHHYQDVLRALQDIPAQDIAFAMLLMVLNYWTLTGYDVLALRYLQRPLAYRKIALASFTGYVFSHNIGLSVFGGAAVRYRLYSSWDLSTVEIAKIIVFCTFTFWLGIFSLTGAVFLVEPIAINARFNLPFETVRPFGIMFVSAVIGYVVWTILQSRPLSIRQWEFRLPSLSISIAQIVLASADLALTGLLLYVLLPAALPVSYPEFLGIFLLALLAGLVSHVPGGLGVFEAVVLFFLSPLAPAPAILGSLLAYRAIYYFLPLLFAASLWGLHELTQSEKGLKGVARFIDERIGGFMPHLLAITTFLSGMILIFSGATPTMVDRFVWLEGFIPLPVLELSHFFGSIAGVTLMFLAWGLQRRLDAAYTLTMGLLIAGIIFSLLKGFDYEEAITLSVIGAVLLYSREHFYRKTSLVNEPFTPGWFIAIAMVLLSSIWLGGFSYRHVEYSQDLWWRFELESDAPRFLRATVGAISVTFFAALARLLRPARPEAGVTGAAGLQQAAAIVQTSANTSANLALLGDKSFLFSASGKSFIMYAVEGRSWVALGDPVGREEEMPELIWRFRELCDKHSGWPVFYEIDAPHLYLYLDLGLTLLKLGEEARVALDDFTLEGKPGKSSRHTLNKLNGEGYTFKIIPAQEAAPLLSELKSLSDAWLTKKNTREKGFSLGFFNEDYLKNFPIVVVQRDGKNVAFANLWTGAGKHEFSVDLMRYLPEHSRGVMDYMFIQLMLWGKQQGYRWFNLGMAPLSGLDDRALTPLWNRLGALVFRHGGHFYNFQGVRLYKEKFSPQWTPKYLASPGGFVLPRILTNIAALISRSLKGVISK